MEPFIGTILAFGFNFPPRGWAFCNGTLLPIRQYTALFSLLGNYYGGDGKVTFGLPNLQGNTAIGFGSSPQMGEVTIGEAGGATTSTMTLAQMPAHIHAASSTIAVPVFGDTGNNPNPNGNALAISSGVNAYTNQVADAALATFNVAGNLMPVGSSTPISTISPYLVLNYSIAIEGIFPSRN